MQIGSPLLVTGASGLLGAAVVTELASRYQIVACHGRHSFQWPGVTECGVDLLDSAATQRLLQTTRPRCIIHLAAATRLDECEQFPAAAAQLNVSCTQRLAEWAAKNKAVFVYMSTDSVFAGTQGDYKETDMAEPVNHYARSKLAGERAVQACGGEHLVIRSNIFGWNAQDKQNLAEWILAKLESGEAVPGFTDVIFNPLLVNTLATLLVRLLERGCRGLLHAGSAAPLSKFDFALVLAREFGLPTELIYPTTLSATPLATPRPLNTSLNCAKLEGLLGSGTVSIYQEIKKFRELMFSGFVSRLKSAIISI